MNAHAAYFQERRRHNRVELRIPGRYMLADGREYPCETVNISPTGIALRGLQSGYRGERIIAYLQDLGRIEGVHVRDLRNGSGFAIEIRAHGMKIERIASRIAWLIRKESAEVAEQRRHERAEGQREQVVLRTPAGRVHPAELIDMSFDGAALLTDVALPVGTEITIGEKRAYVVRYFPGGMAVSFD